MTRKAALVKLGGLFALGALLASAPAAQVAGQVQQTERRSAPSVELYDGRPVGQTGIQLTGWGSGTATETRDHGYGTNTSIRIFYQGFYAGGRLVFDRPIDLSQQVRDPYGALEFVVQFPQHRRGPGGGGIGGGGGDIGGDGIGEDDAPFGLGEGDGDGAAAWQQPGQQQHDALDTRRLRVILWFEEGVTVAGNYPLVLFQHSDSGWFRFGIPLAAFNGISELSGHTLRELHVFGDARDLMWIGQIRTITDDEEIVIDPLESGLVVAANETVEFRAHATGGLAPLVFSWDFDNSDGIQQDAGGPVAQHVFRQPSRVLPTGEAVPFIVTLTVSDYNGVKEARTREMEIVVNQ